MSNDPHGEANSTGHRMLIIRAIGEPAPQGSKTRNKYGATYEVSKKVTPWRNAVSSAADLALGSRASNIGMQWQRGESAPVRLLILFAFRRPKSHYRTGRNANLLRDDAPKMHTNTPDLSKLVRSTEDALVDAAVLTDDRIICRLEVLKVWAESDQNTGATIVLSTNTDQDLADLLHLV